MRAAIVLLLAASLDYLMGDPKALPHPVQAMGWVISHATKLATQWTKPPWLLRLIGFGLGLGVVLGSGAIAWLLVQVAGGVHPVLGIGVEAVLLASCFAGHSLRKAANEVLRPLSLGDLEAARSRLSFYVGRDTQHLPPAEILRAVLETVAENTTDGVTAPLFYAIVGALIPPLGSVPLAIAYKAASTLDSMVGYRREPFIDLGWYSAKQEDILTWLPCRLTVLTLGLLAGQPGKVWSLCRRDAVKDPSPNAGWSECAFAEILGVQLGGTNFYQGVAQHKPLLGTPTHPITPEKVYEALQFMRNCFLVWLAVALVGLSLQAIAP